MNNAEKEVTVIDQSIKYDSYGRMKYHPDYHPNHGKPITEDEKIYIAKFYEFDGRDCVALALGRTPHTIQTQVHKMRKQGKWEQYKQLELDDLEA